jgi:hypothetical protein
LAAPQPYYKAQQEQQQQQQQQQRWQGWDLRECRRSGGAMQQINIRAAFVALLRWMLLSAYKKLELRLMAHLSAGIRSCWMWWWRVVRTVVLSWRATG